MSQIRILLADDQELFRESLRAYLNMQPDFQVIGEASNGEEAIQKAQELKPDIVLMDVRMPIMDGVEATRRLHHDIPGCHIIVLTTFDDDEYVYEALRNGAVGYLLKEVPADKLFEALHLAALGKSFLQPAIATKVVAEFSRLASLKPMRSQELIESLSERELEILRLICLGARNKEIAERLFIAEGTVKNHVSNILAKLGVTERTPAAIKARDLGII